VLKQRTLKKPISATGVGLHSGDKVTMTLKPTDVNTGIVFRRVDLPNSPIIQATPEAVNDTRLCSALEQDGARIATVEHLMSALAGLGVKIIKPIEIKDGDKWVKFTPYHGFKMEFTIDFAHPVFEQSGKTVSIDFADNTYIKEVSRARTFGFMHEVEYLRQNGLARGGSLDNAIVLDEYKVLNSGGLRYEDEFAKHKALDAIGDLYMAGYAILGAFTAYKSGHALNNQILRALLADETAWKLVKFDEIEKAPPGFVAQRESFSPAHLAHMEYS